MRTKGNTFVLILKLNVFEIHVTSLNIVFIGFTSELNNRAFQMSVGLLNKLNKSKYARLIIKLFYSTSLINFIMNLNKFNILFRFKINMSGLNYFQNLSMVCIDWYDNIITL